MPSLDVVVCSYDPLKGGPGSWWAASAVDPVGPKVLQQLSKHGAGVRTSVSKVNKRWLDMTDW